MLRITDVILKTVVVAGVLLIGCGVDDDGPTGTDGDTGVFINELLASNDAGAADPDFGERSDWIELYNSESVAQSIGGWFISDDLATPSKWAIPAGTS